MKQRFSRVISAVLTLALVLTLAGCGGTPSQSTPTGSGGQSQNSEWKVALCTSGPINDNDWNALAYEGLQLIAEKHGVTTKYVESIRQSDQEEVVRNFISEGFNVIFAHGYEYGDTLQKLATEFPDVKFIITSANITNGSNLASCSINNAEQGFLIGVAAALVSQTGHVALLGSVQMPPIDAAMEGFKAGAAYINSKAVAETGYSGSFDDAGKMKELMTSFVNSGVDVGSCVADLAAMGGIEALADAGKLCIGVNRNQGVTAPDTVVTNIGQSYAIAMDNVFQHILDGDFTGIFYDEGVATGAIFLIPNPEYTVPDDVQQKLEQVIEEIKSGKIDSLKSLEEGEL